VQESPRLFALTAHDEMQIVLITGMSGSGKSVALRVLEDIGYYCVDNLPPRFLIPVASYLAESGHEQVAVAIDARSELSLAEVPRHFSELRAAGHDLRVLFLTASTEALIHRYSESRRRHPLSERLTVVDSGIDPTLDEAIAAERELLAPVNAHGYVIDTSDVQSSTLRQWVRQFVEEQAGQLTLAFESFAFKHGVPVATDLLFDVRNLPNPFYDPQLKPLTGLDAPVAKFLADLPMADDLLDDIDRFIDRWLPSYKAEGRHYFTVAIGCTGGQHRSVWMVERLAERFIARGREKVLVRHRRLAR
jgi:RNase adapter protein RapZ